MFHPLLVALSLDNVDAGTNDNDDNDNDDNDDDDDAGSHIYNDSADSYFVVYANDSNNDDDNTGVRPNSCWSDADADANNDDDYRFDDNHHRTDSHWPDGCADASTNASIERPDGVDE